MIKSVPVCVSVCVRVYGCVCTWGCGLVCACAPVVGADSSLTLSPGCSVPSILSPASPKVPAPCQGPLPLPQTHAVPPLGPLTPCAGGMLLERPPAPVPHLSCGGSRVCLGARARHGLCEQGQRLRVEGRSVLVAEAELAADDGHVGAEAQGRDVGAAGLARLGHHRQVDEA